MILDDGDLARLARIERQLAREEPGLAVAMRRWRPPRSPWTARLTVAVGLIFAALAGLLGSIGWALLAAFTFAGWCIYRVVGSDQFGPPGSGHPWTSR